MWFVLAVVFVVVMLGVRHSVWNPRGTDIDVPALTRLLAKYFLVGLTAAFFLTFVQDSVVIVPAGSRGVVFDRIKGVKNTQLNEGISFIVPFLQEATLFDVRVQKAEFDSSAASKDLQSVRTKVALNFSLIPEEVPSVFRQVGADFTEKIVHPAVQEVVKAATARFTAEELIIKREDVKNQIQDLLRSHLANAHLRLIETYITDFDFSPEFSRAIEAKQIAEQDALKAKRDLDRIKIEAEQKVAQARAEAEGLRLQREAITAQLLELRKIEAQKLAIEKWNGVLPQTMMGDAVPFINMGSIDKR